MYVFAVIVVIMNIMFMHEYYYMHAYVIFYVI